jgi:hypothetical protein
MSDIVSQRRANVVTLTDKDLRAARGIHLQGQLESLSRPGRNFLQVLKLPEASLLCMQNNAVTQEIRIFLCPNQGLGKQALGIGHLAL